MKRTATLRCMVPWFALCFVVLGCENPPVADEDQGAGGLLGKGLTNPFPTSQLIQNGHVDFTGVNFDGVVLQTPIPTERLSWRTGFSQAQTSVLCLEHLDPIGLPSKDDRPSHLDGVQLWDMDTQTQVLILAELDAYPDVQAPCLLIRPLMGLNPGHRYGVAVLDTVVSRVDRFDQILKGDPPVDLIEWAPEIVALVDDFVGFGLGASTISIAWDFPVGLGQAPLLSALEEVRIDRTDELVWTQVRNLDDGDLVPPMTWRWAEGLFPGVNLLDDDGLLILGEDGSVSTNGWNDIELYVHIPTSVASAEPGSVPILVFGHGLFNEPADYLNDDEDASGLLELAEEGGYIVLASKWRGLSSDERLLALEVAQDYGRIPELTNGLVQGQVNFSTILALIEDGMIFEDNVFAGTHGLSLANPEHVFYYGISLGAIEGAVLLAQSEQLDATVLHVGGGAWSTMLERSSNWTAFELLLAQSVPDPGARQLLYALSQLWWDPIDPLTYASQLSQKSVLMQESLGDEQVPNITSRMLARSIGLSLLEPAVEYPMDLIPVTGPLGSYSSAISQFDPELPHPPEGNRPAPVTGAHKEPRLWQGARQQVIDCLNVEHPGQVIHHCGAGPCTAENTGSI